MPSDNSTSNLTIHLKWTVGVLAAVIIALVTIWWGGLPDLVNRIMFGLALTSLVLSILVIVLTYYRHFLTTSALSQVRDASAEIRLNATEITDATAALAARVEDIPVAMETVRSEVRTTREELIDTLSRETSPKAEDVASTPQVPDESLHLLFAMASFYGLVALYLAKLGRQAGMEVDFIHFEDRIKFFDTQYIIGYFMALNAIGLFTFDSETYGRYDITWIDPRVEMADFAKAFREAEERDRESFQFDDELFERAVERRKKIIESIEAYFGVNRSPSVAGDVPD